MFIRHELSAAAVAVSALFAAGAIAAEAPELGMPTQGVPSQGIPTQGTPTQGKPTQGTPAQGKPTQGTPGQGQPGQGLPGQGQPGQGQPGQGQPGQGLPGQGSAQHILPNVIVVKVPFDQNGAQRVDGASVMAMNLTLYSNGQGGIDFDRLANDALASESVSNPLLLSNIQDNSAEPAVIQQIFQQADGQGLRGRDWHFWRSFGYDGLYGFGASPYWGAYSWYDPSYGYQIYAPSYGYYFDGNAYAYNYGSYRPFNNYYYYYYYW